MWVVVGLWGGLVMVAWWWCRRGGSSVWCGGSYGGGVEERKMWWFGHGFCLGLNPQLWWWWVGRLGCSAVVVGDWVA